MAVIKNQQKKDVSGKLGPVVVSTWRGMGILRTRPAPSRVSASTRQLLQRAKFAAAVSFLKPIRTLVTQFYGQPEGNKSRYDLALGYLLNDAMTVVDGEPELLYRKILVSKGELTAFRNLKVESRNGSMLRISWDDNSWEGNAAESDRLGLVFVSDRGGFAHVIAEAAERAAGTAEVKLPEQVFEGNMLLYAWFQSAKYGTVCNSQLVELPPPDVLTV